MKELPKYTHENGIDYVLVGDYYIPMLVLPQENRPIGRWGRMHQNYLKEYHSIHYNNLVLSGKLWTYLADLNEQAQERMETIIEQMKAAEGVTEDLKRTSQMDWVRSLNSIRSRTEEIICAELIYGGMDNEI